MTRSSLASPLWFRCNFARGIRRFVWPAKRGRGGNAGNLKIKNEISSRFEASSASSRSDKLAAFRLRFIIGIIFLGPRYLSKLPRCAELRATFPNVEFHFHRAPTPAELARCTRTSAGPLYREEAKLSPSKPRYSLLCHSSGEPEMREKIKASEIRDSHGLFPIKRFGSFRVLQALAKFSVRSPMSNSRCFH